ncbi:hypothetical protein FAZ95_02015 [Trinickia violacea]|uniref:Uncharacterized protein n=1 Tax=Trinickia violacea TaxID=2571746 RepID=A0A4P8IHF0_9BURK|nr:hypothetical protein [Trinickia violacea]QCP48068.1 hypothetical protein FAZ95_02015 [Trinickia violacea]
MASSKPETADGYDAEHTIACERTLVTLLRSFGTLKGTLRLIGGLVPRYLTPESPPEVPAHAGTSDVDIVLNLQVLANDDAYADLADQLKNRGFQRHVNNKGNSSSWRWQRRVSEHEVVLVEFLRDADDKLPGGKVASVEGEGVSALAINHAGIVHEWYLEKEITTELLDDGGIATETIRFADVTAFIVLKALAFDDRAENKDAADLVHVLRYAGSINTLAQQFIDRLRANRHRVALDSALSALRRRFCETDGIEAHLRDGPVACAHFAFGRDPALEEERTLEQRYVAGLVGEFIRLIEKALSQAG